MLRRLPATNGATGCDEAGPLTRSANKRVPADVPSERHSSRPATSSSAVKYSAPLNSMKSAGRESHVAVLSAMFLSSRVPAAVPSLTNGS